MAAAAQARPASKAGLWTGRVLSALAVLFLLLDAAIKLAKSPEAVAGSAQLGFSGDLLPGIGILLLFCTLLYVIPRTAVLGAILLTGYLGGAIASQVRVGMPLFTHVLFPVYFAAVIWGGLYLRDRRVRALLG